MSEVNLSHRQQAGHVPAGQRLLVMVAGGVLAALLVTAVWLSPTPQGYGTHQQLGLPPCTIQFLFGMRCPSCGMTTSWSHFVRGQFQASVAANVGGAFLAVLAVIGCPWLLVSGWRGRWLWAAPHPTAALIVTVAVVAVTLADWTVRCVVTP